jgi:hypothetical protein
MFERRQALQFSLVIKRGVPTPATWMTEWRALETIVAEMSNKTKAHVFDECSNYGE